MKKYLIEKLKALRQLFVRRLLPTEKECKAKCFEMYNGMGEKFKDLPNFKYGYETGFHLAYKWIKEHEGNNA